MSEKLDLKKESNIDLTMIIEVLWFNRKLISLITILFTIIGIIYAFIATPSYDSYTLLYQTSKDQSQSKLAGLASNFGLAGLGDAKTTYAVKDIIYIREVLIQAVKHKWSTEKFPNKKVNLIEFWEIKNKTEHKNISTALRRLRKSVLKYKEDEETGLITLSVSMEEAQLATDLVNFIAEKANQFIVNEQNSSSKQTRQFIDKRLIKVKLDLDTSENNLKQFVAKNRKFFNSPELQLEYNRLGRDVEIRNQTYVTIIQQREIMLIEEVKEMPVLNIIEKGSKPDLKSKPRRKLLVIITMIAGFCCSLLYIALVRIISEQLNRVNFQANVKK